MSERAPLSDANHAEPRRRPWPRLVLIGLLVVSAVLAAVVVFQENVSPIQATTDDPLNFAEVVITDLVQEETLNGELGSIEADPVKVQQEGTITAIAEKGDTVHQGEALFAIDDQPVVLLYGSLPSFRSIAVGEGTVTLANQFNGTITWVAERGAVLEQGDVLYRVDDRPVVVLYGEQPAYRSLGVAGPDLDVAAARAALSSAQANLAALTSPPGEGQIHAARQSLTAAQQGLQDLLELPDPAAVQIAEANLELAEMSLQAAQAAYDQVANQPDVAMSGQAMALWQATTHYELTLAQVLRNLLVNALRHTPSGGSVSVSAAASAEAVEVAVADTGEGIAPQDLPHVFERFWRADTARARSKASGEERMADGTGLRLAVAQSLVEALGGRIWVESTPGEGAVFCFTLPVAQEERVA